LKLSTQILLAFSIVLFLSVIDSYTNYLLSTKVEKNTVFLQRSESIIRNSARLHRVIIEMQSAFRGYLLTGDSNFLETYHTGLREAPPIFNEQRRLVINNANQIALLDTINDMHKRWVDYAGTLIDARQKINISDS
jgi:CHASE3 domain sensor protein